MTKKPNKFEREAATQIRRNGHTVRTQRYLALKKGWRQKIELGEKDVWDKANADHTRFMVDFASGKHGDPEVRKEYLKAFKENPNLNPVERSLLKAEGLI